MDSSQLTLALVAGRARREFGDRRVVSRTAAGVKAHTYEQLFNRVDRLAWALKGLGVERGDRVGTLAWNHHRHLEVYLAATLSGAVLHTINVRLPAEQALGIADHAGDRVVFVDADLPELGDAFASRFAAGGLGRVVVTMGGRGEADDGGLDYERLLSEQVSAPFPYPELDEGEPAATCYSSATTGLPKGVVYSHRALTLHSMMSALSDTWGISESDTVMPVVPMFHVNAWGLPFTALWMGSHLVLPGSRPGGADLLELMAGERVTVSAAVPTVWMDVFQQAQEQGVELPDLRLLISGGAPLPRRLVDTADALGVPLIHSYGMTEASPLVLVNRARTGRLPGEPGLRQRLRQGYVVPGLDYRIVDADGEPVDRDGESSGELQLRGPWVAEEYERDERTAGMFVDGWYRTGDIVTVDAEGYVQVLDRVADVIKSGGEWISSVELENALMDHPQVASAAVVGVPDERWQERPRAYVVCDAEVDAAELKALLEARFPKFWIPDEVVFVDAIPLTSVGKFDKRALRARSGTD